MSRTKSKKEEPEYPKLTSAQLREVTELIIKYGSVNKVLKYWQAVKLDENGNVVGVTDHTEWYNANDYNKAKYENFEPLKGIKYIGNGFLTFIPFHWCNEWMATWSVWIVNEANRGDMQALALVGNKTLRKPEEVAA